MRLDGGASAPPPRLYPYGSLLVEFARRLVAALPPRCPGWAEFCHPHGNRASDACRDGPTQPASHTLDLGTPSQGSSSLSACLLLPALTNGAVGGGSAAGRPYSPARCSHFFVQPKKY